MHHIAGGDFELRKKGKGRKTSSTTHRDRKKSDNRGKKSQSRRDGKSDDGVGKSCSSDEWCGEEDDDFSWKGGDEDGQPPAKQPKSKKIGTKGTKIDGRSGPKTWQHILCQDCGASFPPGAAERHVFWNHVAQACGHCGYEAKGRFLLAEHVKSQHPSELACRDCGFLISDHELVSKHRCPAAMGKGPPTDEEQRGFRKVVTFKDCYTELSEKIRKRPVPNKKRQEYVCLVCGFDGGTMETTFRHVWLMHTMHACPSCQKLHGDRLSMKSHMGMAHPEVCNVCCLKEAKGHDCCAFLKSFKRSTPYQKLPIVFYPRLCKESNCNIVSCKKTCMVHEKERGIQRKVGRPTPVKKKFFCNECLTSLPNQKSLDVHLSKGGCFLRDVSGNLCDLCGKTFEGTKYLRVHMKTFHVEQHCQDCDFVTFVRYELNEHRYNRHRPICDTCGFPLERNEMREGKTEGKHLCPALLGPGAPTPETLAVTKNKRPAIPKTIGVMPDNRYVCQKCWLVFKPHGEKAAIRHIYLMHQNQACPTCGEEFADRPTLVLHIQLSHPLTCINCGYLGQSEDHLRAHDCLRALTAENGGHLAKVVPLRLRSVMCATCDELVPSVMLTRHKKKHEENCETPPPPPHQHDHTTAKIEPFF